MEKVQTIFSKFRAEHLTAKPKPTAKSQILRPPKQKFSDGNFSREAINHRQAIADNKTKAENRKADDQQIEDLKAQGIAKAETNKKASLESLETDCKTRDFGHPRTFQAKKVGHNVPSVKDQMKQHEFLIEQADKQREAYRADGIDRINEVYEGHCEQYPFENIQNFMAQNERAAVQRNHIEKVDLNARLANMSDREILLEIVSKIGGI